MNDENRFKELREKEIKRLTTPLTYGKHNKAYDCEGNPVEERAFGNKHILEPKKGILTDDEILIYAGESKEASRIRLKRGQGNFNDKLRIYETYLLIEFLIFLPGFTLIAFSFWLWIALVVISLAILIYLLFIKDYKEVTTESGTKVEKPKETSNDDLFLLFESKEKIAREMIEKRFPAPQLTNTKFNAVLDNCKEVVESQIEILNALTPTDKTKYEIDSRKKLIKQLIGKVDDLTNELILSEENNIEDVIEDMDNLISSVKEY